MGEEQIKVEEQNNEEQKNKDAELKAEAAVSVDNIYKLDGRVPVWKAIPFGLQHVLAMFVANLAPIAIIAEAASPELAIPLYELVIKECKDRGFKVETGRFGADMQVYSDNDGPVTIIIDSKEL